MSRIMTGDLHLENGHTIAAENLEGLQTDIIRIFDSKDCNGITIYIEEGKVTDFLESLYAACKIGKVIL